MVDFAPCIHVKHIDGTALVTFPRTDRSEGAALAVGGQLSKLAERPGCRRFVLNLSLARCLSSSMFGKLIAFQKKVQQRGGELTLCSPSPEVAAQFERMRLDQLFHICSTEEEGVRPEFGGKSVGIE
jgi:anti-anti-sigma factor